MAADALGFDNLGIALGLGLFGRSAGAHGQACEGQQNAAEQADHHDREGQSDSYDHTDDAGYDRRQKADNRRITAKQWIGRPHRFFPWTRTDNCAVAKI